MKLYQLDDSIINLERVQHITLGKMRIAVYFENRTLTLQFPTEEDATMTFKGIIIELNEYL